jgi:hypothetical protein
MSKRTPEPYVLVSDNQIVGESTIHHIAVKDANGNKLLRMSATNREFGERIVECLNACAGMEKPAEEIEALKAKVRKLGLELHIQADADGAEIDKLKAELRVRPTLAHLERAMFYFHKWLRLGGVYMMSRTEDDIKFMIHCSIFSTKETEELASRPTWEDEK